MTDAARGTLRRLDAGATALALGAIEIYRRAISPWLAAAIGPTCRFDPTCSAYAHEAVARHGLGRGLYLTVRRLLRCRPRGGWGYDPVPGARPVSIAKE